MSETQNPGAQQTQVSAPAPLAPESAPALKPVPRRLLDSVDAPLKIIVGLLALIVPSIAAFFAFKYGVAELKQDTCALAIKVEIMRAINELQELKVQDFDLGESPEGEDEVAKVAKKKWANAKARIDDAMNRAQKRRAHYERAEKSLWKRNCEEIERQAADL